MATALWPNGQKLPLVLPPRAVAQPGSALRSGRRGRWFKSSQPDLTPALQCHDIPRIERETGGIGCHRVQANVDTTWTLERQQPGHGGIDRGGPVGWPARPDRRVQARPRDGTSIEMITVAKRPRRAISPGLSRRRPRPGQRHRSRPRTRPTRTQRRSEPGPRHLGPRNDIGSSSLGPTTPHSERLGQDWARDRGDWAASPTS
jgi:hypothetical protein